MDFNEGLGGLKTLVPEGGLGCHSQKILEIYVQFDAFWCILRVTFTKYMSAYFLNNFERNPKWIDISYLKGGPYQHILNNSFIDPNMQDTCILSYSVSEVSLLENLKNDSKTVHFPAF